MCLSNIILLLFDTEFVVSRILINTKHLMFFLTKANSFTQQILTFKIIVIVKNQLCRKFVLYHAELR